MSVASARAKEKAGSKKPEWKNRILRHGEKPAKDFIKHENNWRIHNKFQRDALNGIMTEIGWVQSVVISVNSGKLIDGHMRVEEAFAKDPASLVPYIEVDLTPDEEKTILSVLDPLGAIAERDDEKFQNLIESLKTETSELGCLIDHLAVDFTAPEFKEYTEAVETEVLFVECPQCKHRFPK